MLASLYALQLKALSSVSQPLTSIDKSTRKPRERGEDPSLVPSGWPLSHTEIYPQLNFQWNNTVYLYPSFQMPRQKKIKKKSICILLLLVTVNNRTNLNIIPKMGEIIPIPTLKFLLLCLTGLVWFYFHSPFLFCFLRYLP